MASEITSESLPPLVPGGASQARWHQYRHQRRSPPRLAGFVSDQCDLAQLEATPGIEPGIAVLQMSGDRREHAYALRSPQATAAPQSHQKVVAQRAKPFGQSLVGPRR